MAIYRLLERQSFQPELVAAATDAYEQSLSALGLVDRNDPLTEIVAQRIMQFAIRGERDPIRLRDLTLQSLH